MNWFLIASLCSTFIGVSAESVPSWIAIKVAQRRHPQLWEHSGSPTFWGNRDLPRSWRLVRYYRDRGYHGHVQSGGVSLPPVTDPSALHFAERLRGPLLAGYLAGWVGVGLGFLFLLAVALFDTHI